MMPTYTAYLNTHYGRTVGRKRVRRVWAEVTKTPRASLYELSARLNISKAEVYTALQLLNDLGYIVMEPKTRRARAVVVPFVATRW